MSNSLFESDEILLQNLAEEDEEILTSFPAEPSIDNNNTAVSSTSTEGHENATLLSRILDSPDKIVREQPELQQYDFYVDILQDIQTIMDGSDQNMKTKVINQCFLERHNEPTPTENDYGMMYLLLKNQSPKRTAADWAWTDDQRVNTVKKMRVRYWKLRKTRNFGFQMRRYVFCWNKDEVVDSTEPVIMLAHLVKDIRQNQAKKVIKKESK
mmetsp:Transcript_5800/g.8118  ORF Transcript_5800/g.8118 Transcript_5800/m.8118 type:complete len:212 (+) Transcript_5800:306-941(+)